MNKEEKIEISVNEEDVQNIINCYEKDIEYIEQLQQENQQLRHIIDELEKWLEEMLNELKQNDVYDRTSYEMGQIIATECIIAKAEELKGNKEV